MFTKHLFRTITVLLIVVSIESCYTRSSEQPEIIWADHLSEIDRYQMMIDSTLMFLEMKGEKYGLDKVDQFQMVDQKSKQEIVAASSRIMDYMAYLDFIRYTNQGFYHQLPGKIHFKSFINYYAAFLVQNSRALSFINIISRNKALDTILNEAYPEYGLQRNSFTEFKSHFLNANQAVESTRLALVYRNNRPDINPYYGKIAMLEGYNTSMGLDYGLELSVKHARDMVEDESFMMWFPIQKSVAEWMGTMRLFREGKYLISPADVADIEKQLIPGDIFFQRREWYFTNAGIPGYWTHAAFFVGDSHTRAHFATDDSTVSWVKTLGVESGSFEELLATTYPLAYGKNISKSNPPKNYNVLEAISPGVVLQTLEKSLSCDGVGVLRPRLTDLEKAQSIYRSFQYYGRAYDYNFDFLTDSTLVCSELVYKTFEPSTDFKGVQFNPEDVAGRIMIPANKMVKQFDREYDTINLDFVLFYDGNEMKGNSTPKDEQTFRASWRRLGIYPLIPAEVLMLSPDF